MTILIAVTKVPSYIIDKWMIIAIIELFVIIVLCYILLKKKKYKAEEFYVGEGVKRFKDKEIDFENMFNSMFNATELHNLLKTRIHPDRFPNDQEKIEIANKLTAQLNESQNNIAKMKAIQAIAIEKLGIKFKE